MTHIPVVGNLYTARGRYMARVTAIRDGRVFLVRLTLSQRVDSRHRFDLSLDFFVGPTCGWKLADEEPIAQSH